MTNDTARIVCSLTATANRGMKGYVAATAFISLIVISIHANPYILLFPILFIMFLVLIYLIGNALNEGVFKE